MLVTKVRERFDMGTALGLALMLFDGVTRENRLVGLYDSRYDEIEDERDGWHAGSSLMNHTTVRIVNDPTIPPRRGSDATFLFFGLAPGAVNFRVRSPYYLPRDLGIVVPVSDPRWPMFPDASLADQTKALDDPTQTAAYRTQRASATLQPSALYPFAAGATVLRGTVAVVGGGPLAGTAVQALGQQYVTGADGEFAFSLSNISVHGQVVVLNVTHPLHAAVAPPVTCVAGQTVVRRVELP